MRVLLEEVAASNFCGYHRGYIHCTIILDQVKTGARAVWHINLKCQIPCRHLVPAIVRASALIFYNNNTNNTN